jgi:molecular chaperone GrpE
VSAHDDDGPRLDSVAELEPVAEEVGLPEQVILSSEGTAGDLLADDDDREGIDVDRAAADLGIELPADPDEAAATLLRALLAARQETGEYLEMVQRVTAESDNYRKRIERDDADNIARSSQRVIERLLPALDSFDAALAYDPQSPAEDKILAGMRGTYAQLRDILSGEGLTPILAVGEAFDPAVHQAAAGPEADGDGPLVVAQELRRGYLMKGRVVRPSLVVVEHG